MGKLFTTGWYDRVEALLALLQARSAAAQKPSGTFVVVVGAISPDPPPPGGDTLFALPNDNTLAPVGPPFSPTLTGINYVWNFPEKCRVMRCRMHGDAALLGTFNTLGSGGPQPHDVDLYIDGAFVKTLFTIGAGATDIDLVASPDVVVPAGSLLQFIIPAPTNDSGALSNFLFSFSIG